MQKLGRPTGKSAEHGTRLGAMVTERLRREGVGMPALRRPHVNRMFRTLEGFPSELANETIESFVNRHIWYHIDEMKPLFEGTRRNLTKYKRRIGNMIPDLVIELPDGSLIIWDLTSKTREEHVAKTILYAHLASVASGGRLIRIGERYWNQYKGVVEFVMPP
jgi:hypothetical protein